MNTAGYPVFYRTVSTASVTEQASIIPRNLAPDPFIIYIKLGDRLVRVDLRQLVWLQAEGHSVFLHLENGTKHIARVPLAIFEERLSKDYFLRVHKAYMVSRKHIKMCYNRRIWLEDKSIPVSRMYLSAVLRFYPTVLDQTPSEALPTTDSESGWSDEAETASNPEE